MARLRISVVFSDSSQLADAFQLLTGPLGLRRHATGTGVLLGHNAVLELQELPRAISAARRLLKRPGIARLAALSLQMPHTAAAAGNARAEALAAAAAGQATGFLYHDAPFLLPVIGAEEATTPAAAPLASEYSPDDASGAGEGGHLSLREVVIGTGSDAAAAREAESAIRSLCAAAPYPGRPGVWSIATGPAAVAAAAAAAAGKEKKDTGAIALRLLPSPMSSIVLCVAELEAAAAALAAAGLDTERVGRTGAAAGQRRLNSPALRGLDLRICEAEQCPAYFNEGVEALMDGLLPEVQSAAVTGSFGGGSKRGNLKGKQAAGGGDDCWMEFRAAMKRPQGFLRGGGIRKWTRAYSLKEY